MGSEEKRDYLEACKEVPELVHSESDAIMFVRVCDVSHDSFFALEYRTHIS